VFDALLVLAPFVPQLAPAELQADLDVLVRDVPQSWSYWEDRTSIGVVDAEAWLEAAREACLVPRSRAEFALILRRAVADLRDGHAGLRIEGGESSARVLPFRVREMADGTAVVESVIQSTVEAGAEPVVGAEPTPEAARYPRVGDRWVALDGRDVDEAFAQELALVFASTPGSRRRRAWRRLLSSGDETCTTTFMAPDGTERTLELRTARPTVSEAPHWSLAWPQPDVALLRVRSFGVERWSEWLAASEQDRDGFLQETRETIERLFREIDECSPRALILDVRGNGGGTDLLGIHVAEHLLEGTFRYFLLSSFTDGHWTRASGLPYSAQEDFATYRGPVVALIDEGCFSTTDNLLRCLDDLHPDFVTVGRPTGGGTGAPRVVSSLPFSGARITLCTQRVYGPLGKLTEGRGTRPDMPVVWTRKDVLEGRDADLDQALRLLRDRR